MASPNTIREREFRKELSTLAGIKFYRSNQSVHNPKRDARRRLPAKVTGRQWKKIRRLLRVEVPETKLTIR